MRRLILITGSLAAMLMLLPQLAFATTVTLTANDNMFFTAAQTSTLNAPGQAGGFFVTEDSTTASGVFGGTLVGTAAEGLIGADFHLEMALAPIPGLEPLGEHPVLWFLNTFESMPGGGADITICCDNGFDDYLTFTINAVTMTNITPGALESVNLGDHNGVTFELAVSGGSLAGFIDSAELFIKLTNPTQPFAIPSTSDPTSYMWDQDFDASANIQIQMVVNPEPSTGLLLGGALGAFALARRRNRTWSY